MGNKTKTWHVIPAVVATAIMSFCGVLIETAMNVTFPTLMTEFNTDSSGSMGNNRILTGYCHCRANYGLFNTKLHDSPTLLGSEPFIYRWGLN